MRPLSESALMEVYAAMVSCMDRGVGKIGAAMEFRCCWNVVNEESF
jgi:hypothetical protein